MAELELDPRWNWVEIPALGGDCAHPEGEHKS
jgi:hypothetical protein